MKKLVLENVGADLVFTIRESPIPSISSTDVLVKVGACGFCHHDFSIMEGVIRRGVRLPLTLGHEVAGEVTHVGSAVTDFRPGDPVVCLPRNPCGLCHMCAKGQQSRCIVGKGLGHGIDGGMAEYVVVKDGGLVKLTSQIPWHQACLLACPIGVALKAINKAKIRSEDTVVVTGAGGGLGTHLVQLATHYGGRVIAVTSSDNKVDILRRLGARDVITTSGLDFSEVVLALTQDIGAEVVLDTVGSPLFQSTLQALAPAGRLVSLGDVGVAKRSFRLTDIIFRDAALIGSIGVSKHDIKQALQLVESGKVKPIVSDVLPWDQARSAYELMKRSHPTGRLVLTF